MTSDAILLIQDFKNSILNACMISGKHNGKPKSSICDYKAIRSEFYSRCTDAQTGTIHNRSDML